jgi:hypothetical protein
MVVVVVSIQDVVCLEAPAVVLVYAVASPSNPRIRPIFASK